MATFPTLTAGERTHRPWFYRRDFLTSKVNIPTGKRYAFHHRATPLMRWVVGGDSLSDADLATLRTFFLARAGNYEAFSFTDPETASVYSTCRFEEAEFKEKHIAPNENSIHLTIVEIA